MSTSVQEGSSYFFNKFVGKVKAKPQAEQRLSLGNYGPNDPAKGFSIQLNPSAEEDDVITNIVTSGSPQRYELMLYVTNRSDRPVSAEVWRM